jgi:hypothetical protein
MGKKLGIIGIIVGVLGAAALIASLIVPAVAAGSGGHTRFKVYEKGSTFSKDVDADDSGGPSAGDYNVAHANDHANGKVVGSDRNYCFITAEPTSAYKSECTGTIRINGKGSITATGWITFTQNGPAQNPTKIAITGGTGAYEGASGTLSLLFHSHGGTTLTADFDHM